MRRFLRGLPALLLLAALVSGAAAQTDLGGQRVATSSGTFLKIGLDARGAALGGAYAALVQGPTATFTNPARLMNERGGLQMQFNQALWPADLQINSVAASIPFTYIGLRVAVGLASLNTSFDETTEYYPAGTGRTAGYSDFLGTLSAARSFTDRLSIGVTAKYLREDLASNLGGPVTSGFLLDAGSVYELGYRNSRFAVVLSNFGSDLDPEGQFESRVTGSDVSYSPFSPPTQFQLAFAIDPYESGPHRLTATTVILHQADNAETVRGGAEYQYAARYALRSGYDLAADEMAFSAGLGVKANLLDRHGFLDYAWTAAGHLGNVHRFSIGLGL